MRRAWFLVDAIYISYPVYLRRPGPIYFLIMLYISCSVSIIDFFDSRIIRRISCFNFYNRTQRIAR
jgi:hypothetical protein